MLLGESKGQAGAGQGRPHRPQQLLGRRAEACLSVDFLQGQEESPHSLPPQCPCTAEHLVGWVCGPLEPRMVQGTRPSRQWAVGTESKGRVRGLGGIGVGQSGLGLGSLLGPRLLSSQLTGEGDSGCFSAAPHPHTP